MFGNCKQLQARQHVRVCLCQLPMLAYIINLHPLPLQHTPDNNIVTTFSRHDLPACCRCLTSNQPRTTPPGRAQLRPQQLQPLHEL